MKRLRFDDLSASENIEDRRTDPPRSYWRILMDWFSGPKEVATVVAEPPSQMARDMGIDDLRRMKR
jgi:hypothetical protein